MSRIKEQSMNWIITRGGGLFNEADIREYTAENTLSITPEVVDEWRRQQYRILEIGPGSHLRTFLDLLSCGVDVVAIEPTLLFHETLMETYEKKCLLRLEQEQHNPFFTPERIQVRQRVQPLFASETYLHPLLQEKKADIAFAQGINFQSYTETKNEFLLSLSGIMNALSDNGYLMYELYLPTDTTYDDQENPSTRFNIINYLQTIDAQFEIKQTGAGANNLTMYKGSWCSHLFEIDDTK